MLVDFDNVEPNLTAAGPTNLAKALASSLPTSVLLPYDTLRVRMYGGWRVLGNLTTAAQRLVPDIRAGSPTLLRPPSGSVHSHLRIVVELAESPLGSSTPLAETLVRERELRKFRARVSAWPECVTPGATCGLNQFAAVSHSTACSTAGCAARLGNILVRDEQKMVDTMMVADLAYEAFVARSTDIVIVSSDTDVWPGILLALQAGANVTHVHTRHGWKTQRHLLGTLSASALPRYRQLSV
jgi:hypothetical protein